MSYQRIAAITACLLLASSQLAFAATTEVVEAAEREAAFAVAKKDKAEAEAAEAKAKLGTLTTTDLPKGKGEATGLNVEGKILAYSAVDRIATSIATSIASSLGAMTSTVTLVIYADKELNAVLQARALRKQTDILNKAIPRLAMPAMDSDAPDCRAPPVGGSAALGPLGSIDVALQVLSLFKVDKKLDGIDVTVDDFALAMAVLDKVREARPKVRAVYPASYLPGVFADDSADIFSNSKIVADINTLADNVPKLETLLADIAKRKEALKKRVDDKNTPKSCATVLPRDLKILDNLEATATSLKARADKLVLAVMAVDEKTGATLLQTLAVSETLAREHKGAFVLQLKPVAAGGATLTKTNLFTTTFRFSGGAIVSYMLLDGTSGVALRTGTIADYGGYFKPDQLIGANKLQMPVKP